MQTQAHRKPGGGRKKWKNQGKKPQISSTTRLSHLPKYFAHSALEVTAFSLTQWHFILGEQRRMLIHSCSPLCIIMRQGELLCFSFLKWRPCEWDRQAAVHRVEFASYTNTCLLTFIASPSGAWKLTYKKGVHRLYLYKPLKNTL